MRQTFHRIRSNPEAYAEGYRNTRRALIRRFIVVLAVLHCGRDPTLWRQRSST
ncbi:MULTISPECIES: hypothetical protein [unclassified Synechococcus]|uniref:hypothetical protein n=1 Tax=Synechococcales TaxID=1890424 RepID=UPI001C8941D6|nr:MULTISPECIES: hypothetical protein [unclassified Synechococcus]